MPNPNQDRLSTVADVLVTLTYSEMMELAQSLADIHSSSDDFDTCNRDDWAKLLHVWAENYGEE